MIDLTPVLGPALVIGWTPSLWEIIMILVVGLLLFGRRLPEVGRSLGKSIVEFKKGLKDVHTDIDRESTREAADPPKLSTQPGAVSRGATEAGEAKASGQ